MQRNPTESVHISQFIGEKNFPKPGKLIHRIFDLFDVHKLTRTYIHDKIDLKVD
jgi:hypothetical protein